MLTKFERVGEEAQLQLGAVTSPYAKRPSTQYGAGRQCACGTRLSIYNSQDACSPCVRRDTLSGKRKERR